MEMEEDRDDLRTYSENARVGQHGSCGIVTVKLGGPK
jgi:hypothetical protein